MALQFRANNAALIKSRDEEVILSGPAGTGKTIASLYKLHAACIKYPRIRCLIVRKTRKSLTDSALVTYEEKILDWEWRQELAAGCTRKTRDSYIYPDGSTIIVGGIDNPSKIMSTEYDLIYANQAEELTEGDWESLGSRLRNYRMPYQQMMGDANPDAPTHWIKHRSNNGSLTLLESRHEDNPQYYDVVRDVWTDDGVRYMARLERLTGVRFLRLRRGIWAGAEGQIYDTWDEAVHVIDPFDIPKDWPRYRSVDFGFTNPFVCQWWAMDGDGRLYLYRELYGGNRIVSDWAILIKRAERWTLPDGNPNPDRERIEYTVADWDAEGRATLEDCGIPTIPATKNVTPGIEAVQLRLRVQADGRPRLFIVRGCTVERDARLLDLKKPASTQEEVAGYVWAPPLPNRPPKEEPMKINDHGCDAMRYMVAEVDGLGTYSAGVV